MDSTLGLMEAAYAFVWDFPGYFSAAPRQLLV
jgi:hypothetical protein